MYTLLLDSSNKCLSVGLAKENKLIDVVSYEAWQRQSEMMIPEIRKLFDKHHVENKDIDSVMVSVGPGSYTGVRISITIAKVISFSLSIPLYPVSSLEVLKNNDKPSICLINARSQRSYFAVYFGGKTLIKDTIFKNDEVINYINEHKDYEVCGDVEYLGLQSKESHICQTMLAMKKDSKSLDPMLVNPVYMKD